MHRDELLTLSLDELKSQCEVRGFQGSGPGGQHRNKTNTGVLLIHRESNLEIRCCEDRSASVNRTLALQRLRLSLAVKLRQAPPETPAFPFPGTNGHVQTVNPGFARLIADVLDRVEASGGEVKPAAVAWGISASALVKLLFQEKAVIEEVQALRKRHGKGPLKMPG